MIDIRAVDSLALPVPKGAPHDIVQAIGRALRQKPGQGKVICPAPYARR